MTGGVPSVSKVRRPSNFRVKELAAELDLEALGASGPLAVGLSNVRYWLSYEQSSLEELLFLTPSPLLELGIAATLEFSEDVQGTLTLEAVQTAQQTWLPQLVEPQRSQVARVLQIWSRCLQAQAEGSQRMQEGFRRVPATSGISIKDLEAVGHAHIQVNGQTEPDRMEVPLGAVLRIEARDSKGRPLSNLEIEHPMAAQVWVRRQTEPPASDVVFAVPGPYRIRVPSRATGERLLVAG